MAEAVYAIEDFPADELLWRIEWIGGVGYNANVPSDPLIDVCLAQLPVGETNQLSARSRSRYRLYRFCYRSRAHKRRPPGAGPHALGSRRQVAYGRGRRG